MRRRFDPKRLVPFTIAAVAGFVYIARPAVFAETTGAHIARVTALVAAAAASPVPAGTTHRPTARELEKQVDAYVGPLAGCDVFQGVVLIARGGNVVVEKAYGMANVELGIPNTPDKVFRIASLTKPFTEVLLGRLVEKGTLRLEDPLSRWLPGFAKGDSITLEMLRTHKAGIPNMNSFQHEEDEDSPHTLDSLIRTIAAKPLDFPPGSRTRYSNGNYAVLAAVIQKATGMTYGDAIQREVLTPLGLTHTYHESNHTIVMNKAYGYSPSPYGRHVLGTARLQEMDTKAGGGSLVSTARDLQAFLRAMYHDNVIKTTTWNMLFDPDTTWSFQGRCPGYNVFMLRDFKHDAEVIVLANNYGAGMVAGVGTDLMAMALGGSPTPPKWRGDVPIDLAKAQKYVGTYMAAAGARLPYGNGPFTLEWKNGGLIFSADGAPTDYLLPQEPGTFLVRNLWSELRFEGGGSAMMASIRPLWFTTDAVALQRTGN